MYGVVRLCSCFFILLLSAIASAQTAAPGPAIFSLISGSYTTSQTTTLDCGTPGAVIRYSMDGSDITTSSTLYTGPITIASSVTIKARAFLGTTGGVQSSGTYTIEPVQPAIFSLISGTYTDPQVVSLNSGTTNAQIRYTTNGADVTASSTLYSGPLTISGSMVIKAKAFLGSSSSVQSSGTYTIMPQAAVFSLISGTYTGSKTTTLSSGTPGAVIRYSMDGSDITTSSTLYTGPITIASSVTIKARAFLGSTGGVQSSGTYTIEPVQPAIFSLISGTYTDPQVVSLSSGTANAQIRYTTNGADVTASSTLYSGQLTISGSMVIKAKAFLGSSSSVQSSGTYTIRPQAAVFSLISGTYNGPQTTTLSTGTAGATIRYSMDGSNVTTSSTLYTGPITINNSVTIKAKAFLGSTDGVQSSGTYVINNTVYTVSATAGTGGSISPASVNVNAGSTATFTVTPAAGYQINQISGCGKTGTSSPFTTAAISASCSVSATFNAIPTVAAPVISPNGGSHVNDVTVSLTTATAGAELRYTTNGSDVTVSSPLYTGPFRLVVSATVKARGFKTGMQSSSQVTQNFVISKPKVTVYRYDDLGRLITTEDTVNGNRNYQYDAAGNRTNVSVGNN